MMVKMKQAVVQVSRYAAVLALGLGLAQGAAAQSMGSVSYAPLAAQAQNVPTLSEWALIGMAALLAVVAFYTLRSQSARTLKVWAAGLLACTAVGATLWNTPAEAIPPPVDVVMDQPNGGTASIPHRVDLFFGDFFYIYKVQNQTSRAQRVTGVSVIPGLILLPPTGFTPQCTVGLVLQPNDMCYVRAYNQSLPG